MGWVLTSRIKLTPSWRSWSAWDGRWCPQCSRQQWSRRAWRNRWGQTGRRCPPHGSCPWTLTPPCWPGSGWRGTGSDGPSVWRWQGLARISPSAQWSRCRWVRPQYPGRGWNMIWYILLRDCFGISSSSSVTTVRLNLQFLCQRDRHWRIYFNRPFQRGIYIQWHIQLALQWCYATSTTEYSLQCLHEQIWLQSGCVD